MYKIYRKLPDPFQGDFEFVLKNRYILEEFRSIFWLISWSLTLPDDEGGITCMACQQLQNLGRFSFANQGVAKPAQCHMSALFWISLAGEKNQPKTKQKSLLNLLLKIFSAQVSIVYAGSIKKLSSINSNPILTKETHLASFSCTNVYLHHCENTVSMKVAWVHDIIFLFLLALPPIPIGSP